MKQDKFISVIRKFPISYAPIPLMQKFLIAQLIKLNPIISRKGVKNTKYGTIRKVIHCIVFWKIIQRLKSAILALLSSSFQFWPSRHLKQILLQKTFQYSQETRIRISESCSRIRLSPTWSYLQSTGPKQAPLFLVAWISP